MGAETKITLTLPTELVEWLEEQVATGDFPDMDAAILAAIRAHLARRARERAHDERLHQLLDEAEKGPWFDGEEVFRELVEESQADLRATSK
jgi:Arc/MetJ-type ribon-helix-helix transcriptional regulator